MISGFNPASYCFTGTYDGSILLELSHLNSFNYGQCLVSTIIFSSVSPYLSQGLSTETIVAVISTTLLKFIYPRYYTWSHLTAQTVISFLTPFSMNSWILIWIHWLPPLRTPLVSEHVFDIPKFSYLSYMTDPSRRWFLDSSFHHFLIEWWFHASIFFSVKMDIIIVPIPRVLERFKWGNM